MKKSNLYIFLCVCRIRENKILLKTQKPSIKIKKTDVGVTFITSPHNNKLIYNAHHSPTLAVISVSFSIQFKLSYKLRH